MEGKDVKRFEEIVERESLATEGPWLTTGPKRPAHDQVGDRLIHDGKHHIAETFQCWSAGDCNGNSVNNAEFIANAREDIPWLIELVQRLLDTIDNCMVAHVKSEEAYIRLADNNKALAEGIVRITGEKQEIMDALRSAAEEAYRSEVIDTEMKEHLIGEGLEFADKEDWIDTRLSQWLVPEQWVG